MYPKAKITSRQAKVLAAIVKENCDTGQPVASQQLVDKRYFDLSGPTIRNEMRVLERLGYIYQPHTSAGRVPTDAGYKYFIAQLMKHVELSAREQSRLQAEIRTLQQQHYELGRSITRLLAETSNSAAFALLPGVQVSSGFSNIMESGISKENLKTVANFFDNLDKSGTQLSVVEGGAVKTFIGTDSPVPLSDDVSMMVSNVKLSNGKKGIVGIVGSKRMKYAKNMSLLEYVSKLIGGSGAAVALLLLFN